MEDRSTYRRGLQQRSEKARADSERRVEQAWEAARRAADLLRTRFAVEQVLLFGSLARGERLFERSDIDLAVAYLPDDRYFEAIALLQDAVAEFKVDLVVMEHCKASLRDAILEEAVSL